MARLPGDPSPWGHLRYALGLRLPAEHRDWIRHDLTDAGWRGRMITRHLAVMLPLCSPLALMPGEWWLRLMVPGLALLSSALVVVSGANDLRDARLRRHDITVHGDPDRPRHP